METENDDLDGAGDRFRSIPDLNFQHYVKRRLTNGLPVPVYQGDRLDDDDNLPVPQSMQRKILVKHLKEFYSCPICRDTFIETTATSCGHKFCRHCIDEWRKENGFCPICSAWITSQHRLYSDDVIVESQLNHLSPKVKHCFESARQKRLQQIHKERAEIRHNVVKRFGQKFRKLCFGDASRKTIKKLGDKICLTSTVVGSKLWECGENCNFCIISGILIIGVLAGTYWTDSTQFTQYMWLAMKNYDGKIPQDWLQTTKEEQLTNVQSADSRPVFEVLLKTLVLPIRYAIVKVKDSFVN